MSNSQQDTVKEATWRKAALEALPQVFRDRVILHMSEEEADWFYASLTPHEALCRPVHLFEINRRQSVDLLDDPDFEKERAEALQLLIDHGRWIFRLSAYLQREQPPGVDSSPLSLYLYDGILLSTTPGWQQEIYRAPTYEVSRSYALWLQELGEGVIERIDEPKSGERS